jgi:uncharacterized protein
MTPIVHSKAYTCYDEQPDRFYEELFEVRFEKEVVKKNDNIENVGTEYYGITMTDEKGNKRLIGKILERPGQHHQGIANYIGRHSIEEYSLKVQQLGGKVMMHKIHVYKIGYYAIYSDTEGNVFAIWQFDIDANELDSYLSHFR